MHSKCMSVFYNPLIDLLHILGIIPYYEKSCFYSVFIQYVENLVRIFIRSAVKSKIYFMCISLFCHIVLGINPRHNFIVSRFLCLLPTAFCIRSLHIFRIRNILRNGCLSRFLQSLYMAAQTCYLHRQKDNCQQ